MRMKLLALVAGLGLGFGATSAGATPLIPPPHSPDASSIVQVAQGCGRGMHRNFRGYCTWNRGSYGYRPYYRYRPYGFYRAYPYYGGGDERLNRPSPSDHVANQLNAQQARRGWGYMGY